MTINCETYTIICVYTICAAAVFLQHTTNYTTCKRRAECVCLCERLFSSSSSSNVPLFSGVLLPSGNSNKHIKIFSCRLLFQRSASILRELYFLCIELCNERTFSGVCASKRQRHTHAAHTARVFVRTHFSAVPKNLLTHK